MKENLNFKDNSESYGQYIVDVRNFHMNMAIRAKEELQQQYTCNTSNDEKAEEGVVEKFGPFVVDYKNKKIIIDDGWEIYSLGNFKLRTAKHLMLNSGRTPIPCDATSRYSIWFNTDEDDDGNPVDSVKGDIDENYRGYESSSLSDTPGDGLQEPDC